MRLKTKILSALALSAILATSMTAQMQEKGMQKEGKACDMKQAKMKGCDGQKGGHGIMPLLQKLNLTDEQQKNVKAIMQETMKKQESKYSAFSEESFDKNKYIKQMKNAQEDRIKLQAETIEKVYVLLTPKQKSQLRVLMDLNDEKMKKGCDFDKNCDGRR
ncbi:MAG: Spy/CpxP family protein refolding chaperone [Arcobacteraceae bacterium]